MSECTHSYPHDAVLDERLEQGPQIWHVQLACCGYRIAWNEKGTMTSRHDRPCPGCGGDPEKVHHCHDCNGTGLFIHVPYCPRGYDEIISRLWLGGHDCQPYTQDQFPGGYVKIGSEFDRVFSLYQRPFYGPDLGIPNHFYRMADADLDPEHHSSIDDMADRIVQHWRDGEKILIRCQAGMNRSGLLMGLALIRMGHSPDEFIPLMRAKRSPYVLFNESFVDYLYTAYKEMDQQ